jgi:uncharacterized protein YndB with AHSA1/START domain
MSNATAPPPRTPAAATEASIQTLNIVKEVQIDAPVDVVWESILEEIGQGAMHTGNQPMPMKLEPWPGGRWYRDLGDNSGHLWAHVQVIKPPKLLELAGPMFMSYPAMNHLQYRLAEQGNGTLLKLTHRAFGLIDPEHAKGVQQGWGELLENIRRIAERRRTA